MGKYRAQTNCASWQKGVKKSLGLKSGENDNLNNTVKKYRINSWGLADTCQLTLLGQKVCI